MAEDISADSPMYVHFPKEWFPGMLGSNEVISIKVIP